MTSFSVLVTSVASANDGSVITITTAWTNRMKSIAVSITLAKRLIVNLTLPFLTKRLYANIFSP